MRPGGERRTGEAASLPAEVGAISCSPWCLSLALGRQTVLGLRGCIRVRWATPELGGKARCLLGGWCRRTCPEDCGESGGRAPPCRDTLRAWGWSGATRPGGSPGLVHRPEVSSSKRRQAWRTRAFLASACVPFAHVPVVKASHWTRSRFKGRNRMPSDGRNRSAPPPTCCDYED